ncbi:hypothetical protein [Thiohalorhabdus methylotrophus]|uniref:Uncharacterized protein n=1 Tax=Thiohalorhabdus methylotrophus TaxID=3242694 RepID=A0ABV4TVE9_9GAMM
MRFTGLVPLLLLTLATASCGEVEPGSFQAFDTGEDGADTTESTVNGIWTGSFIPQGGTIGRSATAVIWEGRLLVLSSTAELAHAGEITVRTTTTPLQETFSDPGTLEQQLDTSPGPTFPPPPDFVPDLTPTSDSLTSDPTRTGDPAVSPRTDSALDPRFTTESDFAADTTPDDTTAANRTVEVTGDIRSYSPVSGTPIAIGQISGTVIARSRLQVTVSGTQRPGVLELRFSDLFRQEVLVSDLVGSWSMTRGDRTLTLTVDSAGALNGSRSDGCLLSGELELLRRGENLFRVVLSIDNCAAEDGRYTGFAFLDPETLGRETGLEAFWILAESDGEDRFFNAVLDRQ